MALYFSKSFLLGLRVYFWPLIFISYQLTWLVDKYTVPYYYSMFLLGREGWFNNPTPEKLDAILDSNITEYKRQWMSVPAHEIGHVLGANEVLLTLILTAPK
jgi:hypothetical protein